MLETAQSPLRCVTPAHIQVMQKAASFVWGPEQEKALPRVHAAVQAALLGPYDAIDLMVLEVSVAARDVVWDCRHVSIGVL